MCVIERKGTYAVASFPGSPHILQATESWAGPGNEATYYKNKEEEGREEGGLEREGMSVGSVCMPTEFTLNLYSALLT